MSWAALAIGAAGVVTSAVGSAKASSAQNKATSNANLNSHVDELKRLINTEGPQKGLAIWKAQVGPAITAQVLGTKATAGGANPQQQAQIDALKQQITTLGANGGGTNAMGRPGKNASQITALQTQLDALQKSTGATAATKGILDENQLLQLGPGVLEGYQDLATKAEANNTSNLAGFDAETAGLNQKSQDIEASAKNFGVQQLANLRTNTDREHTSLDRAALANLNSHGLGAGSAATDALRGNADTATRAYNDQAATIENQQIGLKTGLAGNTLGLATNRAAGRNSLLLGGQSNIQGLKTGALNVENSALNASEPYYPGQGADSAAAALMTAGAGVTGAASPLAGYAFRNWMSGNPGSTGSVGANGVDASGQTMTYQNGYDPSAEGGSLY